MRPFPSRPLFPSFLFLLLILKSQHGVKAPKFWFLCFLLPFLLPWWIFVFGAFFIIDLICCFSLVQVRMQP